MYLLSKSPTRRKYACKLWTTFKKSTVFDAAANACTAHIILKTMSMLKAPAIIDSKLYSLFVSDKKNSIYIYKIYLFELHELSQNVINCGKKG